MCLFKGQQKRNKFESGFTLVETLVAIVVLTLIIVGPMSIAARGLQTAYFANDQTTAIFLAQEAMEAIIKLRDDNALSVADHVGNNTWSWYENLDTSHTCTGTHGCDVDINTAGDSINIVDCTSDCAPLTVNAGSSGRKYWHGAGNNSIYTRTVYVTEPIAGQNIAQVIVKVKWNSNLFGKDRYVILQTWIYDQYDLLES